MASPRSPLVLGWFLKAKTNITQATRTQSYLARSLPLSHRSNHPLLGARPRPRGQFPATGDSLSNNSKDEQLGGGPTTH